MYGFHPWLIPNGDIITCRDAKDRVVNFGRVSNSVIYLNNFYDKYAKLYKVIALSEKRKSQYPRR